MNPETLFSKVIGSKGYHPNYETSVFDMKDFQLEFGDKVLYNARKGYVEACFFLALTKDPVDLDKPHRQTCYVLCMEGTRPCVSKVSAYYLLKTNWDNKYSPSDTLTAGYALLRYIEAMEK